MVVAALLGAVAGILGFLPLLGSLALSKRVTSTSNLSHATSLLLGVFGSLLVLALTAFLCVTLVRDLALPFVLAEALALCVAAVAFGVVKLVRK